MYVYVCMYILNQNSDLKITSIVFFGILPRYSEKILPKTLVNCCSCYFIFSALFVQILVKITMLASQLTFTCSKSIIEIQEKGVKYVQI